MLQETIATPKPRIPDLSLTYLDRFKIKNKKKGLTEPSGLALSRGRNALWTVSDDTRKVFKLSVDGRRLKGKSFKIGERGLEGLTLDPSENFLLAVKEESNEILKISIAAERIISRHALSDMAGFGQIAQHFSEGDDNKGLEGMAFNQDTGTFFVLKEGDPGLLIEVSRDLASILGALVLDRNLGFADDDLPGAKIDFSGIQYDGRRSVFWIVSDKARRVYLYDWVRNRVIQSVTLGFGKGGKYREIKKAEGVAVDPRSDRLYVVSDKTARLYVFDIR
jgi:uncharacterized protein YjiK